MTYGASVLRNTPGWNKIACHRASNGIIGSLLFMRGAEGHVDQAASALGVSSSFLKF